MPGADGVSLVNVPFTNRQLTKEANRKERRNPLSSSASETASGSLRGIGTAGEGELMLDALGGKGIRKLLRTANPP